MVFCHFDDLHVVLDHIEIFFAVDTRVVENDKTLCDNTVIGRSAAVSRFERILGSVGFEKFGGNNVGVDVNFVHLFFNEVVFIESVKLCPRKRCFVGGFDLTVVYLVESFENGFCEIELRVVNYISVFVRKRIFRYKRCADKFVAVLIELNARED